MFNLYPYLNVNDLNLDYIVKYVKQLVADVSNLHEWCRTHEQEYEELKALYDAIMSGNFPQSMIDALVHWCETNIVSIMGEMAKMVIFGITDDGYFVAYIPTSWDEIQFGTTGLDDFPAGVEYGHLTLSFTTI